MLPPHHNTGLNGNATSDGNSRPWGRADGTRRECELCERRTWCQECHGMTVCDSCKREYMP